MRLIIILLLFTLELLQAIQTKETCYTVQLISKLYTEESRAEFKGQSYPQACEKMHIGSMFTVRCGCYGTKNEAIKLSKAFEKDYAKPIVTRTYKYRFSKKVINTNDLPYVEILTPKLSKVVAPIVVAPAVLIPTTVIPKVVAPKVVTPKIAVVEVETEKVEVITPIELLDDVPLVNKIEKKKKKTKKKKVKKAKKQKIKLVSKTKNRKKIYTEYGKYLRVLKSTRGYGKYDYIYKFGAQFQYDVGYVDEAYKNYSKYETRKFRLYHKGSFFNKKLFYELEYSLLNKEYKDIYIGYKNSVYETDYRVKVGNIKQPFSLEQYTSSKYSSFMENSLNDAFYINRKLGVELYMSKKMKREYLTAYVSVFRNSIQERIEAEEDHTGAVARVVYAHKFQKNHLVSIGASYMHEKFNEENIKFKQGSESKFNEEKYISDKVKDVDVVNRKNIELYYQYLEYALQAEALEVELDARKGLYVYNSYYLQGSYFLFGAFKKYKLQDATLSKIKIYKGGALELVTRYSYLNLEDSGTQKDYNFGFNWYLNNEVRFMLNYIISKPTKTENYDGLLQLVQARVQIAF